MTSWTPPPEVEGSQNRSRLLHFSELQFPERDVNSRKVTSYGGLLSALFYMTKNGSQTLSVLESASTLTTEDKNGIIDIVFNYFKHEPTDKVHYIDLDSETAKKYDKLSKTSVVQIGDEEVVADADTGEAIGGPYG